ncbi:hypothetical protein [Lewinella sp. IMCC34183]|uniref:hypothetical protein n=1 Tax=Lewinella sp. IMCC34183 TaxID=2248762 RepID=UPI000E288CC5|nr:hypothetical protein [Lewinella sp. IMCC34183]
MRAALAVLLLLSCGALQAQLTVGADAGAGSLTERRATLVPEPLAVCKPAALRLATDPGTRVPAPFAETVGSFESSDFDFASTKPYLAFFCRLELNIEAATHFPVRFRLGEVRGWQQELTKRD